MAVLWIQDERQNWMPHPLGEQAFELAPEMRPEPPALAGGAAFLAPLDKKSWLLLCGLQVAVNGDPVVLGIRALQDRDTIRVAQSGPVIFSLETLPQVVAYPATLKPVSCARCGEPVAPGDLAVQCPHCATWYHQKTEHEYQCWTYAAQCTCGHATALDGSYNWSPEGL